MVDNGKTTPLGIITPAPHDEPKACHKFFAPVVIPEMDRLTPNKMNVTPRLGNFPCLRDKCMLWNADKLECWDVTAARGLSLAGEYAFNMMNDVHIEGKGS